MSSSSKQQTLVTEALMRLATVSATKNCMLTLECKEHLTTHQPIMHAWEKKRKDMD